MNNQTTLDLCKAGITKWQEAFNNKSAEGCAKQYTEEAVMNAKPFGTFHGRTAIQEFWQNIMDQGYSDVSYSDVSWEKVSENSYILSSRWTMNKAFGVVHKELWVVQPDGLARLESDDFEVLGER